MINRTIQQYVDLRKALAEAEKVTSVKLWMEWEKQEEDTDDNETVTTVNKQLGRLGPFLIARGYDLEKVVKTFNDLSESKICQESESLAYVAGCPCCARPELIFETLGSNNQ